MMRRASRLLATTTAAVTFGVLSFSFTATVAQPLAPRAQAAASSGVVIAQANLQEALRPADVADPTDVDNFVDQLLVSIPAGPDALLLTEILGPGARRVADRLQEATGKRYQVAVAPGDSPWLPDGGVRASAIIVNASRLQVNGDRGFLRVNGEDQAFAFAEERSQPATALQLPLLSTLAQGDPAITSARVAEFVDRTFPSPASDPTRQVAVVGGDWRFTRCTPQPTQYQPLGCEARGFWSDFTTVHAFSDALFERGSAATRADDNYLFVRGRAQEAEVDTGYDQRVPDPAACHDAFNRGDSDQAGVTCRERYYAQTPFRWATLDGGDLLRTSVIPEQLAMGYCELGSRLDHVVARVVNASDRPVSVPVSAEATSGFTVHPAAGLVDVPAHQARYLPIQVSTPDTTPDGDHRVEVTLDDQVTTVPVSVPDDCIEPRVFASSWHVGFEPANAIDGSAATFWHSEYSPPHPLPQSITLNLGEPRPVDTLTYLPRQDGNLNGTIRAYNISVSTDGHRFTHLASGTWTGDARLKTATFPTTTAKYVTLQATQGHNGSYASAAEVEVPVP